MPTIASAATPARFLLRTMSTMSSASLRSSAGDVVGAD
jgi:hypothetical protein